MSKHRPPQLTEDEINELRLEHSRWLVGLFEDPASIASQTVAAYEALLDDVLLDIAIDARRDAHYARFEPQQDGEPHGKRVKVDPLAAAYKPGGKGTTDIFGSQHPGTATELVSCQCCGRKVQAGKFAYHMEKCLGKGRLGGRSAARRG